MSNLDADLEKQYAEVLDNCFEQLSAGVSLEALLAEYPDFALQLKVDLDMATWLGRQKEALAPRAGFLQQSRSELLNQIKTSKPPEPTLGLAEFWRWLFGSRFAFRLATALVLIVLIFGSLSGVAYAAQASIPGDSLYPVKLSIEDVRLWFSSDPVSDASLYLTFANERLAEMSRLIDDQRADLLNIPAARYDEQMSAALQVIDQVGTDGTSSQHDRALAILMDISARLDLHAQQMAQFGKGLGAGQEKALDTAIRTLQELQLVTHGLSDSFGIDLPSDKEHGNSPTGVAEPDDPATNNSSGNSQSGQNEPPGPAVATSRAETRTAEPAGVEAISTATPKDKENSKPATPPGLDRKDDQDKDKPEKPTKKPKTENPNKPQKEEDD